MNIQIQSNWIKSDTLEKLIENEGEDISIKNCFRRNHQWHAEHSKRAAKGLSNFPSYNKIEDPTKVIESVPSGDNGNIVESDRICSPFSSDHDMDMLGLEKLFGSVANVQILLTFQNMD